MLYQRINTELPICNTIRFFTHGLAALVALMMSSSLINGYAFPVELTVLTFFLYFISAWRIKVKLFYNQVRVIYSHAWFNIFRRSVTIQSSERLKSLRCEELSFGYVRWIAVSTVGHEQPILVAGKQTNV